MTKDEREDVLQGKLDILEVKSKINDVDSATVKNAAELSSANFTLKQQQQALLEFKEEVSDMKKALTDINTKFKRISGILLFTVLAIGILIILVVVNGKTVHQETGLNENENTVINDNAETVETDQ